MQDIVAPGKIPVEFAARAGRAGDDELAVPVIRQPYQDARFPEWILGHASLKLNARHGLGDGRAKPSRRRYHAAIGLRSESAGRQSGHGVVGRRRGGVVCGEIGALEAGRVGNPGVEKGQQSVALCSGRGRIAGRESGQSDDGAPSDRS